MLTTFASFLSVWLALLAYLVIPASSASNPWAWSQSSPPSVDRLTNVDGATLVKTSTGKILRFGGSFFDYSKGYTYSTNELFELFDDWVQIKPKNDNDPWPNARARSCGIWYETEESRSMIILFGHYRSKDGVVVRDYNDVWFYNADTGEWRMTDTKKSASPIYRHAASCALRGDSIIVYGGVTVLGRLYSDFWSFHIPTETWHPIGTVSQDVYPHANPYQPPPSYGHAHAYDSTVDAFFLHGGRAYGMNSYMMNANVLSTTSVFYFVSPSEPDDIHSFDLHGYWRRIEAPYSPPVAYTTAFLFESTYVYRFLNGLNERLSRRIQLDSEELDLSPGEHMESRRDRRTNSDNDAFYFPLGPPLSSGMTPPPSYTLSIHERVLFCFFGGVSHINYVETTISDVYCLRLNAMFHSERTDWQPYVVTKSDTSPLWYKLHLPGTVSPTGRQRHEGIMIPVNTVDRDNPHGHLLPFAHQASLIMGAEAIRLQLSLSLKREAVRKPESPSRSTDSQKHGSYTKYHNADDFFFSESAAYGEGHLKTADASQTPASGEVSSREMADLHTLDEVNSDRHMSDDLQSEDMGHLTYISPPLLFVGGGINTYSYLSDYWLLPLPPLLVSSDPMASDSMETYMRYTFHVFSHSSLGLDGNVTLNAHDLPSYANVYNIGDFYAFWSVAEEGQDTGLAMHWKLTIAYGIFLVICILSKWIPPLRKALLTIFFVIAYGPCLLLECISRRMGHACPLCLRRRYAPAEGDTGVFSAPISNSQGVRLSSQSRAAVPSNPKGMPTALIMALPTMIYSPGHTPKSASSLDLAMHTSEKSTTKLTHKKYDHDPSCDPACGSTTSKSRNSSSTKKGRARSAPKGSLPSSTTHILAKSTSLSSFASLSAAPLVNSLPLQSTAHELRHIFPSENLSTIAVESQFGCPSPTETSSSLRDDLGRNVGFSDPRLPVADTSAIVAQSAASETHSVCDDNLTVLSNITVQATSVFSYPSLAPCSCSQATASNKPLRPVPSPYASKSEPALRSDGAGSENEIDLPNVPLDRPFDAMSYISTTAHPDLDTMFLDATSYNPFNKSISSLGPPGEVLDSFPSSVSVLESTGDHVLLPINASRRECASTAEHPSQSSMVLGNESANNPEGVPCQEVITMESDNPTPIYEGKGFDPQKQTICAICISEYVKGDRLVSLPCLHRFHRTCAHAWLVTNALCPICKANAM